MPFCWHDLLLKGGTDGGTPRSFSGSAVRIRDVEPQCVLYLPGSKSHVVTLLSPICRFARRDGCRPLGVARSRRASTSSPFRDWLPCRLSASDTPLSYS